MTLPLLALHNRIARADVIRIIHTHGSADPIPLARLCELTNLSERTVKDVVSKARLTGEPLGARRSAPWGYYECRTAEELEESAKLLVSQAKRMLVAAGRLVAKQRIRELLGQEILG